MLPVEQRVLSESHEVNLTAAARLHRRKENLQQDGAFRNWNQTNGASIKRVRLFFVVGSSYLVIPFTQELQLLSLFMHEHSLQVPRVRWPQLYGLFSPTHHLVRLQVGWIGEKQTNMRKQSKYVSYIFTPYTWILPHLHAPKTHTHRLTTILFLAHPVPDLSPLNVVQVKFSVAGQLLIQI